MTPLQESIFQILKWFDRLCRKENLRYYVIGGTFIGAVRHKGFIPWDDDADVAMPRQDYEKLIELFSKYKDNRIDRFLLETVDSKADDFFYTYGKLYDTTTTMIERTRKRCRRGVFLDIFPLDGLGNTMEEAKINFKRFDRLNMFLLTRTCALRKERKFYKNVAILISRCIPSFMVNEKKLAKRFDTMCKERDFDNCKYVCNLSGYRSREIMERKLLGNPCEYEFEGIRVLGPELYDEYLTHIFGDWRKLPPKDKQISNHDFISYDLKKSYLLSDN